MAGERRLAPDNEGFQEVSFSSFVKKQKNRGIRTVTIWGGSPHLFVDPYERGAAEPIRNALEQTGLTAVCYRPESYGYSLCAAPGSLFRKASLDYYQRSAEMAKALGITVMELRLSGYEEDREETRQMEWLREGLRRLDEGCRSLGISLLLQNGTRRAGMALDRLDLMERILEGVSETSVGISLNVEAADESLEVWFSKLGSRIRFVRLARPEKDQMRTVDKLGYQGVYGYSPSWKGGEVHEKD